MACHVPFCLENFYRARNNKETADSQTIVITVEKGEDLLDVRMR